MLTLYGLNVGSAAIPQDRSLSERPWISSVIINTFLELTTSYRVTGYYPNIIWIIGLNSTEY